MTDTCNNRTFSLSESQVDALTDRQAYGQTDSKQTDRPHSHTPAWHQLAGKTIINCVSNTLCANAQAVKFTKRYRQTNKQQSKQKKQQACCQCYLNATMRCCILGVRRACTDSNTSECGEYDMQHVQWACESEPEATRATLLPLLQTPQQCCGCATARHQKPHWQRCLFQTARHAYAVTTLSYRWTYHLLPVHAKSPHPAQSSLGFCT